MREITLSSALFELLCVQAEAGKSIDLAAAGTHATFYQARTMAMLMNRRSVLRLFNDGYDDWEMVELRLLECELIDKPSDRPATQPPDDQQVW